MRLKAFEFDISNSLLINTETQTQHHLTRTEAQVLEQLVNHPNQVMSKGQLSCAGSQQAVMSESAVAKAVFTLRKYFGEPNIDLIETLPKKGYRLNISTPSPEWQQQLARRKKHLVLACSIMLLVVMLLITAMHQYIWFKTAESPVRESRIVTLNNHQQIDLIWLQSPKKSSQQVSNMELKIIAALNLCPKVKWRDVYLALSNDMQVLNISMEGYSSNGELLVRNIKTSDFTLRPNFISQNWLQEVSLCD
ncbi:winged helix-turn-helix domain-containing protein [Shewanella aestuarii]|jgi:DNA-binding winged helix-turn-helix (wHTH) protein|uniref:winged helix-turn-helix domain-containing protein n=1 Tax=Shewanella aestuarii TaxID=1028752 RepID=UPI00166722F4|nr:winged helix-turn-helix domain-containing protein [Shewanella aestuarii]GGN79079.1 hypothetical protein GCM10009193_22860 [Shewanella aestuarii]